MEDNKQSLYDLGPGHHFGEWWGQGINRGYGLKERKFSLFYSPKEKLPICCDVVPTLYDDMTIDVNRLPTLIDAAILSLQLAGSIAAPNYLNPEGIVIHSKLAGARYKVIINK